MTNSPIKKPITKPTPVPFKLSNESSSGFKFNGTLRTVWFSKEIKVPQESHLRVRAVRQAWSATEKGVEKIYVVAVQQNIAGTWKDIISRKVNVGATETTIMDSILKSAGSYRLRVQLRPTGSKSMGALLVEGVFSASPDRSGAAPNTPQIGVGAESLEAEGADVEDPVGEAPEVDRPGGEAPEAEDPNETGEDPAPNETGEDPAPNETGEDPAPNETGEDPAPNETGEDPAPNKTGEDPAPNETGEDPAPNETGEKQEQA